MRTAFADQRRCWFGGGITSSNPVSSSGESAKLSVPVCSRRQRSDDLQADRSVPCAARSRCSRRGLSGTPAPLIDLAGGFAGIGGIPFPGQVNAKRERVADIASAGLPSAETEGGQRLAGDTADYQIPLRSRAISACATSGGITQA